MWDYIGDKGDDLCANVVCEIRGELDLSGLYMAVRQATDDYEVLRTTYQATAGIKQPLQVIGDTDDALRYQEVDLSEIRGQVAGEKYIERLESICHHNTDPGSSPSFQVVVGKISRTHFLMSCTVPYLATDRSGLWNVVDQIGRRYSGQECEEIVQYADYVEWQRELETSSEAAEGREYWGRQVAAVGDCHALPFLRERVQDAGRRKSGRQWQLEQSTSGRIQEFANRNGFSVRDVLLAVWSGVVMRLSGGSCVKYALELDGRPYDELRTTLGYFARRVPFQVEADEGTALRDVIERLSEQLGLAYQWQDCMGEATRSGGARWLEETVRVGFALRSNWSSKIYAGVEFQPFYAKVPDSPCSIDLTCFTDQEQMGGSIRYDNCVFKEYDIDRLIHAFTSSLRKLGDQRSAGKDVGIIDLPITSAHERRQVAYKCDNTDAIDLANCRSVVELISGMWLSNPDRPAVAHRGTVLTYRDLATKSKQLADELRLNGVIRGDLVGLYCHRTPELIIGIMGILMTGAGYVPLDPKTPTRRIANILDDAKPKLLVSDRSWAFVQDGYDVIYFDECPVGEATDELAVCDYPDDTDIAYVIYTSGSTGRPKGVVVTHGNLGYSTRARCEYYSEPVQAFLLLSSHAFDSSVAGIFWTLAQGGCLVLPDDDAVEIDSISDLIKRHEVSHTLLLPSLYDVILDETSSAGLKSLRVVIVAGESCSRELASKHLSAGVGPSLFNEYGPSEATVWSTVHPVNMVEPEIPIGSAIPGAAVFILDSQGQPLPIGVPGEICIGGPGVTKGYLGNVADSSGRLCMNPFRNDSSVLYRSGDRGRYRDDGVLEFMGRMDQQVKIRGYRVECEEVEQTLLQHQGVREVVVVDVPGAKLDVSGQTDDSRSTGSRLVAYLVMSDSIAVIGDEIRRHAESMLPDYMVPSFFIKVDAIPRLLNGKIDRASLRARPIAVPCTETDRSTQATPTELCLARIWGEVLGIDNVDPHANFYELGGDSIQSIQIASRAARHGIHFTALDLFHYPTVAELVASRNRHEADPHADEEVVGEVPLTPIQSWFLDRDPPDPHHRNIAVWLKCKRRVELETLRLAAAALINHHDALRMRFKQIDGQWKQYYGSGAGAETSVVSFDVTRSVDTVSALQEVVADMHESFDLEHGPMIGLALIDGPQPENQSIFLVVHHLVADVISLQILIDDLEAAYSQAEDNEAIELPTKTHSYKQWSEALLSYASSDEVSSELEYWKGICNSPVESLTVDYPDQVDVARESSRKSLNLTIDEERMSIIASAVRRHYSATVAQLLLAALARSLRAVTKGGCYAIDVEGHGRENIDVGVNVSRTIGWFTSVRPVVVDTRHGTDFASILEQVKQADASVSKNGLGFSVLRYMTPDHADADKLVAPPKTEVSFNYLGRSASWTQSSLFEVVSGNAGSLRSPRQPLDYLVNVVAKMVAGKLHLEIQYSDLVFRRETIQGIRDAFRRDIQSCVDDSKLTDKEKPLQHDVEMTLPLSPQQKGLLFHSLCADRDDVYFTQTVHDIRGSLDMDRLENAWQQVGNRNPMLRASFHWEGLDDPEQAVHWRVVVPWSTADLRGYDADEQIRRIKKYIETDREKGFDLDSAPLARVAVFRLADQVHRLVWSSHHLIMDGWSSRLVFREILETYDSLARKQAPSEGSVAPYSRYLDWLQSRDKDGDVEFWKEAMEGIEVPTPLKNMVYERSSDAIRLMKSGKVSTELGAGILDLAKKCKVTANTVVHGAWAILLGEYSGKSEVVFGSTCSGRSAGIQGIENMIGLFITTLPVSTKLSGGRVLHQFLKGMQADLLAIREHEHCALWQVQRWVGIPSNVPLFESIVVFENFPDAAGVFRGNSDIWIERVPGMARNSFPLTIRAMLGSEFSLDILYDSARISEGTANTIWHDIEQLLGLMVNNPDGDISFLRSEFDLASRERRYKDDQHLIGAASEKLRRRSDGHVR